MKKLDNVWLSLLVGALLPLFFGWLFMVTFYHGELSLFDALKMMSTQGFALMSKLILVALVPNLFLVFVCYSQQMWKAGRGFFIPVLFYLALAMFFI